MQIKSPVFRQGFKASHILYILLYQIQQAPALVAQAFEAGVLGAEHVTVAVADEVGLGAVDVEAGAGGVDEAGGRLAAAAGFAVCGELCLGVMRAVVEGVEVGADFLELAVHPVVDAPDVALGVVATGNAGLIRHKDGEVAAVVDIADGLLGSGDPDEVFRAVEVVDVDVEGAVAVEEDCLSGDLIRQPAAAPSPKGKALRAEDTVSWEGFLFAILIVTAVIEEGHIFLDSFVHIGEALVVAGGEEMRRVGLGEVLVLALEDFREVAVGDLALAHGLDDGLRYFVVAVGVAGAAVVDAGRAVVLPEPEVDAHDVLDVDEVAALLAVFDGLAGNLAPAAEQVCLARLVDLVVELVEDGGHLALVVLLRAVDVEVLEADDLAVGLWHDLAHVTVEGELREGVRIQGVLTRVALAEAVLAAAVRRGGRGVHEGDAVLQAEVQQGLRVLVVRAHHEVDVVLHRVGAGALVEDCVDVRAVEVVVLDALKEVVLVLVVNELQAAEVLVVLAVLEVVDDQDVRAAAAVEFFDDVAADETGTTCYDNHVDSSCIGSLSDCLLFIRP